MRPDLTTVNADIPIAEFRVKFPLGSKTQVVALDAAGRDPRGLHGAHPNRGSRG